MLFGVLLTSQDVYNACGILEREHIPHRYFDCIINNIQRLPRVVLMLLTLKRIIQEDRREDM